VLPAHPIALAVVQVCGKVGVAAIRVGAYPGLGGLLQDKQRLTFIQDLEIIGEIDQRRAFPHDVVRQTVQRPHPVPDVGQQAHRFHQVGHAPGEVVHG